MRAGYDPPTRFSGSTIKVSRAGVVPLGGNTVIQGGVTPPDPLSAVTVKLIAALFTPVISRNCGGGESPPDLAA